MRLFNSLFLVSGILVAGCATKEPVYPLPRAAFPEPGIYLVQPGDSVTLIAKHLCLSVDQLAALNPGIDFSRLKIGHRLYYAPSPLPVRYHNARYDLTFYLPASWRGYSVLIQRWDAPLSSADYQTEIGREDGPIIVLRNPRWKADDRYQDIPIIVFTRSQWAAEEQQHFFPYACGLIGEMWHNRKYVFGIYNRYQDLDIQSNGGVEVKGTPEAADLIERNRAANNMPHLYPQ